MSRADFRPEADLYLFDLKDPIPSVPMPLRVGEPEPAIHLQHLVNQVYGRARFDLAIDYSQPVKPALSKDEMAWVKSVIESGMARDE
jgi:hypothetical protein